MHINDFPDSNMEEAMLASKVGTGQRSDQYSRLLTDTVESFNKLLVF